MFLGVRHVSIDCNFPSFTDQQHCSASFADEEGAKENRLTSCGTSSFSPPLPNRQSLFPTDISRSAEQSPTQPKLTAYHIDGDRRSFRSVWFSQFSWLEYSEQTDLAFCFYCRHFSTGVNLNIRVRKTCFILFFSKLLFFSSKCLPR